MSAIATLTIAPGVTINFNAAEPDRLDHIAKVCALTAACEELDYPEVAS